MQRQTSLEVYWADVQPKLRDLQAEVLSTIKRIGPVTDLELEAALPTRRARSVESEIGKALLGFACRGSDWHGWVWQARLVP